MPSRPAISSALKPEPSRNAFRRLPMSSKRIAMASGSDWLSVGGHSPIRTVPLALRRIERRDHDVLVARAAAEIAGDGDPHLLLRRVRVVAQELDQRGQYARGAEAAL